MVYFVITGNGAISTRKNRRIYSRFEGGKTTRCPKGAGAGRMRLRGFWRASLAALQAARRHALSKTPCDTLSPAQKDPLGHGRSTVMLRRENCQNLSFEIRLRHAFLHLGHGLPKKVAKRSVLAGPVGRWSDQIIRKPHVRLDVSQSNRRWE